MSDDDNTSAPTDSDIPGDIEFNKWVDRANRIVRPLFTLQAFITVLLVTFHIITNIHPLVVNIDWTIVTFWFGSRILTKDIPAGVEAFQRFLKSRRLK